MVAALAGGAVGSSARKLAALLLLAFLALPGTAAADGGVTGLVSKTVNGATGTVGKVTDPVTRAAKLPSVQQVADQATPVVTAATRTVDRTVANTAATVEPVTRTVNASTAPVTRKVTETTTAVTRTIQPAPASPQRGAAKPEPVTRRADTALAAVDRTVRAATGSVAPTLESVGRVGDGAGTGRGLDAAVGSLLDPKTGIGAAVGSLLDPTGGLGATVGSLLDPEGGLAATLGSVLGLDDPLDPVGSLLRGLGLFETQSPAAPRPVSVPAAPALPVSPPRAFAAAVPRFGEDVAVSVNSETVASHRGSLHGSVSGPATAGEPLRPLPGVLASAAPPRSSAMAEPAADGPRGPSLPDLPAAPSSGAATASSALLFAGFAALFGAFALLLTGLTRTLHTAPAFLRPAPFICLLERPG